MKASEYEALTTAQVLEAPRFCISPIPDMGLAPGGLMRQEIYEDSYGFEVWDTSASARCFVHILNSVQYFAICGVAPPHRPPTAHQYTDAGLPWFDYFDADQVAVQGAKNLAGLDSVASRRVKQGRVVRQPGPLGPVVVQPLSPQDGRSVGETQTAPT